MNIKYTEILNFSKDRFFSIFVSLIGLLWGCSPSETVRNPHLNDTPFQVEVNLNLPQYDALRFAGGALYVNQGGIQGLLILNLNGNQFLAWEASCANHPIESCSRLSIEGVLANCQCAHQAQYSLATGQWLNATGENAYPLLNYTTRLNGNILRISN
ncbi:MAG: hypothetical protein ACPGC5_01010 [Flavobacteriaceae bacterium]